MDAHKHSANTTETTEPKGKDQKTDVIEDLWTELQGLVRLIYNEAKISTKDKFRISFEQIYSLVYKLCRHDPEALFHRLENEAQDAIEKMRLALLSKLATISLANADTAGEFLDSVRIAFTDLECANAVFDSVLVFLFNCFLCQFHMKFSDLNRGLFWEMVYVDPIIQCSIPRLKSHLKKTDTTLQQYTAFEKHIKDVRAKWTKVKKLLDGLDKNREARLKEECDMQKKWQNVQHKDQVAANTVQHTQVQHAQAQHSQDSSCIYCQHPEHLTNQAYEVYQQLHYYYSQHPAFAQYYTNGTVTAPTNSSPQNYTFVGVGDQTSRVPYLRELITWKQLLANQQQYMQAQYQEHQLHHAQHQQPQQQRPPLVTHTDTAKKLTDSADDSSEYDSPPELADSDEDDQSGDEYEDESGEDDEEEESDDEGDDGNDDDGHHGQCQDANHNHHVHHQHGASNHKHKKCCPHCCPYFCEFCSLAHPPPESIPNGYQLAREKLRHKLNTLKSQKEKVQTIQSQPQQRQEDDRSLEELLEFIESSGSKQSKSQQNTKQNKPNSSQPSAPTPSQTQPEDASQTAKSKKKRSKRKKNKGTSPATSSLASSQTQQNDAAPSSATTSPEQNGTDPHAHDTQPSASSPPSSSHPETAKKLSLLEKIAGFKDFPRFWADDSEGDLSDDMDPALKEQQDKEIEDFKKRLEIINSAPPVQKKPVITLGNKFQEIAALCRNKAKEKEGSDATPNPNGVTLGGGEAKPKNKKNKKKKGKKT